MLQTPLTEQGALALVQVVSLVPPPEPEQVQVELPPQAPATVAVLLPAVQPNWTALLHVPLIGHAALANEHVPELDPPFEPEHVH